MFHGALVAALLCSAGCSTPIARRAYTTPPTELPKKARVAIKEVHRGQQGGVVVVEVTNLADAPLTTVHGSAADLRLENGGKVRSLKQAEFEQLVEVSGPIAMGFESWSVTDLPTALDPLGSAVNLQKNESTLVAIGFADATPGNQLRIDLAPAMHWRDAAGRTSQLSEPLSLVAALPDAPHSKLPTKDSWRKLPINFAISSDDF
jgi:hypothetical protein